VINLKYNFDKISILDKKKDSIIDSIYDILDNIHEDSLISYSSDNIEITNNSIIIKAIYNLSKNSEDKILKNKSLNNIENLDYFITN
jgi:hypothetical protein